MGKRRTVEKKKGTIARGGRGKEVSSQISLLGFSFISQEKPGIRPGKRGDPPERTSCLWGGIAEDVIRGGYPRA